MDYYPKIQTVYNRDPLTFIVNTDQIRCSEFKLVKEWIVTEKLHGSNHSITISHDPLKVGIRGRTDKAQINDKVDTFLQMVIVDQNKIIDKLEEKYQVVSKKLEVEIFGEVVGKEVQGEWYKKGLGFYIFDILLHDRFMEWSEVKEVCNLLNLEHVLDLGIITLPLSKGDLLDGIPVSQLAKKNNMPDYRPEGIVARTEPQLYNKYGQRVMWKLKYTDFNKGKK